MKPMTMSQVKARDVLRAAKDTYSKFGNEDYAKMKASLFLKRCGIGLEDSPDTMIDVETINKVTYAMLDEDAEQLFWTYINSNHQGVSDT